MSSMYTLLSRGHGPDEMRITFPIDQWRDLYRTAMWGSQASLTGRLLDANDIWYDQVSDNGADPFFHHSRIYAASAYAMADVLRRKLGDDFGDDPLYIVTARGGAALCLTPDSLDDLRQSRDEQSALYDEYRINIGRGDFAAYQAERARRRIVDLGHWGYLTDDDWHQFLHTKHQVAYLQRFTPRHIQWALYWKGRSGDTEYGPLDVDDRCHRQEDWLHFAFGEHPTVVLSMVRTEHEMFCKKDRGKTLVCIYHSTIDCMLEISRADWNRLLCILDRGEFDLVPQ